MCYSWSAQYGRKGKTMRMERLTGTDQKVTLYAMLWSLTSHVH